MVLSEFKQVIVVRIDLKMGRGKIAAQVAHASLSAAEQTKQNFREWYNAWMISGQAKVVVKVASLQELLQVKARALQAPLPVAVVEDRGLTQVPSGTVTCMGIGPAPSLRIDTVTGGLKLL